MARKKAKQKTLYDVKYKTSFQEYTCFNYSEKKAYLGLHHITGKEYIGKYNKIRKEVYISAIRNPFAHENIIINYSFPDGLIFLPDEFHIKVNLVINPKPNGVRDLFKLRNIRLASKAEVENKPTKKDIKTKEQQQRKTQQNKQTSAVKKSANRLNSQPKQEIAKNHNRALTRSNKQHENSKQKAAPIQPIQKTSNNDLVKTPSKDRINNKLPAERKNKHNQIKRLPYYETILKYHNMQVEYLYKYYPLNNGMQDDASKKILKIKQGYIKETEWIANILKEYIIKDSYICIVPSSKQGNTSKISPVIWKLSEKININFIPVLYRCAEKEKAYLGAKRSVSNEYKTLIITEREQIKGKDIILIDDICTTGCSLFASKTLLLKSGARSVRCIAIGRTTSNE